MICKKCGKEIPDESVFCAHCGCDLRKNTSSSHSRSSEDQIPLVFLINQIVKHKIAVIISVVIVALASIEVEIIIRRYIILGQEETWTASVASYWGGIIGGVVSGILAFLGVFYTIRYYKESDAQKERAAVQPFLMVELGQDPKRELRTGYSLGAGTDDKEKQKTIHVAIKNIGHGFAKTLVIHTGYKYRWHGI